jgi:hypothetical protein
MIVNPNIRMDLALYDLERLGLWLEAEQAQMDWDNRKPYVPTWDAWERIPAPIKHDIDVINGEIALN